MYEWKTVIKRNKIRMTLFRIEQLTLISFNFSMIYSNHKKLL